MASASNSYKPVLRASTVQQTSRQPTSRLPSRKRPSGARRIEKEPTSDIYLVSAQDGAGKHTHLSQKQHTVEAVQPNTYVARLIRNPELPEHPLVVAQSSIQGDGVFTPEGQVFLPNEILSSYSRGAKFAFRLKHQDWAGTHKISCFLAFIIGDNNEIQPVSRYEYILWTHARVKWKQNCDMQLGILPADRPIRMINHQKSAANAEIVTLLSPHVYAHMEQEGDDDSSLIPVVDAQKLLKTREPGEPLPVQVIFQAKNQIGPQPEELFFDYFEGDKDQEEFDSKYESVWISWNPKMKNRIRKLTGLKVSDDYAPPHCGAAPAQAPDGEEVSLHYNMLITYEKAIEGGKENIEAFIRAFAKRWRYHHPKMQLLLASEFEKKDTWNTKEFNVIRDFYRALLNMLNNRVPAPDKQPKWSISTLGNYLVESDLFDLTTCNRLIHPDWLSHLSCTQPEKYEVYLKRHIRQQLADGKSTNPLARLLSSSKLRTCDTHEEFTYDSLCAFITRHNLESFEDVNSLARQMGSNLNASGQIRRLISNGDTEAVKAVVREFIKERHYSIQRMVSDGPFKTISITGCTQKKHTSIQQLVQFINTHMPEEACDLIKAPLFIHSQAPESTNPASTDHEHLLTIWKAVTEATDDAGEKSRKEQLKAHIKADNQNSILWLECHIRHCFTRTKERNTARFCSPVLSSLEFIYPLSSISEHLKNQIPELKKAVEDKQKYWNKYLLLRLCAHLGINNVVLQNGQLLATHIAVEMGLTSDIKMTDTHAHLLHPRKTFGEPEALPNEDSHNPPGIGELVEQDITANYETYSQNITSQLASLWYTRPLNELITRLVMLYPGKASSTLNTKKIVPPYGGDSWTSREIADYLLRHDLTSGYIDRTGSINDKRPFAVFIAENLPYCWQHSAPENRDTSIPEGLEEKVAALRRAVNHEIKNNPQNYTNTTLIPLARRGFVSASNEMISRLLPKTPTDRLIIISKLRDKGIYVYLKGQWHWPTYPIILAAMKEHKFVSQENNRHV